MKIASCPAKTVMPCTKIRKLSGIGSSQREVGWWLGGIDKQDINGLSLLCQLLQMYQLKTISSPYKLQQQQQKQWNGILSAAPEMWRRRRLIKQRSKMTVMMMVILMVSTTLHTRRSYPLTCNLDVCTWFFCDVRWSWDYLIHRTEKGCSINRKKQKRLNFGGFFRKSFISGSGSELWGLKSSRVSLSILTW